MKIDFYTKLILTIIAICLVHLSIESFSFTKSAQAEDVVNVRIIGTIQPIDVNLSAIVGRELVESKLGMTIGVSGKGDYIIPINWGTISIE